MTNTSQLFEPQPASLQLPLQDRVIINRVDNICHAILKGKWPSSSQQLETQGLLAAPALPGSAGSRSSFAESEGTDPGFNNGMLISEVPKVIRVSGRDRLGARQGSGAQAASRAKLGLSLPHGASGEM